MTDTNQLPCEREAFEAFAQNCPMGKYSITRRGDGYDSSHTQLMWDAWQARAQAMQAESGACKSFTELRERHREGVDAELAAMAAEAKTDEPVGEPRARVELAKTGGNAGLSTRIIELDIATRERLRPGDLLYTRPAPGVPDDAVLDSDRLDWLSRNPVDALDVFGKSRPDEARFIRATIDAAMTAAQAQKGQP